MLEYTNAHRLRVLKGGYQQVLEEAATLLFRLLRRAFHPDALHVGPNRKPINSNVRIPLFLCNRVPYRSHRIFHLLNVHVLL